MGSRSPRLARDWRTSEYASHWRLLTALFDVHPIRSVLETGSGRYSTHLFLERFKVERLVSVENNPEWAVDTAGARHEFHLVAGPVHEHLPDLDGFDLVFVDDDPPEERITTVRKVLSRGAPHVVVHDTDWLPLLDEIRPLPHYTDRYHRPHTSVVWPHSTLDRRLPK